MTPVGLIAMRKAAAIAFAVPGVEVDIVHGGRLIVRVERGNDTGALPLDTTVLSPCAFRGAVGRAHQHAESGGTAVFIGLGVDDDPLVGCHMPCRDHTAGGTVTPLGLVTARMEEMVVQVFATPLNVDAVRLLVSMMPAELPASPDLDTTRTDVNVSWDPVSCVTLVYSEARLGAAATAVPHMTTTMESLMFRCAIDEISTAVAAEASRTGR